MASLFHTICVLSLKCRATEKRPFSISLEYKYKDDRNKQKQNIIARRGKTRKIQMESPKNTCGGSNVYTLYKGVEHWDKN